MAQPAVSRAFLRSVGVFEVKLKKRRIKLRLLNEDPHCYYCGCKLTIDDATLDHAFPVSKGGKTKYANSVLACYQCNQDKADKTIVIWGRR